jgi:hypothetical protein
VRSPPRVGSVGVTVERGGGRESGGRGDDAAAAATQIKPLSISACRVWAKTKEEMKADGKKSRLRDEDTETDTVQWTVRRNGGVEMGVLSKILRLLVGAGRCYPRITVADLFVLWLS